MIEGFRKFTCDACGGKLDLKVGAPATGWGTVAISIDKNWWIGDSSSSGDFCPSCMGSLNLWKMERRKQQQESDE